jgi:hypothetical protein
MSRISDRLAGVDPGERLRCSYLASEVSHVHLSSISSGHVRVVRVVRPGFCLARRSSSWLVRAESSHEPRLDDFDGIPQPSRRCDVRRKGELMICLLVVNC